MERITTVLIIGLALFGLITLPRGWRNAPDPRMPPIWPQGRAAYMAGRRSIVVSEVGLIAVSAILVFPGTVMVSGCIFIATGFLMVSIFLFNRPQFLVPPRLRSERGFVEEYRLRRKERRS